jgi:hypothetical protein
MDFIYLYETELKNLLQLLQVWWGGGWERCGDNVNNVQYKSNQNCHYEFPPYNEYILIKIYNKKINWTRLCIYLYSNLEQMGEKKEQVKWHYLKYGTLLCRENELFLQQIKDMERGELGRGTAIEKRILHDKTTKINMWILFGSWSKSTPLRQSRNFNRTLTLPLLLNCQSTCQL